MAILDEIKDSKTSDIAKTDSYSVPPSVTNGLKRFQLKFEAKTRFFIKNFFKTKFMVSMSKKIQMQGIEKVFLMGPKAFFYFFMFYLIRDTIIYIVIPIYFARMTGE